MIKGKANASAVGTLVERTSGYLMLVKMNGATATSAMEGFSAALNSMPLAMRKSMTYDQGREMARHAEITQKTGVAIYFFIKVKTNMFHLLARQKNFCWCLLEEARLQMTLEYRG